MGDERRGAREAGLLAGEQRDHERAALGRALRGLGQARRREQRGRGAGRVVVGAVVHRARLGSQRALAAEAEVIVVGAEHDDLAGQTAAAGQDAGHVHRVEVRRAQVDAAAHPDAGARVRARHEVAVDRGLERREVDPRRRQPFPRDLELHLQHRDAGRAFRPVVPEHGEAVLPVVLGGTGHEHHRGRAPLAGLQDLVAQRRPAARPPAVEGRRVVLLLRLVAQDERDLAREVDAVQLAVADGRGFDAVADKGQLAGERAGAGESERRPVLRGDALELVGGPPVRGRRRDATPALTRKGWR